MNATTDEAPVRYGLMGMDCLSCATKIEGSARKVPGVDNVRVSALDLTVGRNKFPTAHREVNRAGLAPALTHSRFQRLEIK
jgi:copper chaperone CopZ